MENWEQSRAIVKRRYPSAEVFEKINGKKTIMVGDWDMLDEYLLETDDDKKMWEYAKLSTLVTQNFNRTHPLRNANSESKKKYKHYKKKKS